MGLMPWEPAGELIREPFENMLSLRDAMNRLLEDRFIVPKSEAAKGKEIKVHINAPRVVH